MSEKEPPTIEVRAEVVQPQGDDYVNQRFTEIVFGLVNKAIMLVVIVAAGLLWSWLYDLWFRVF